MTVEPITMPANNTAPHIIRAINAVTAALAGEGISKSRHNPQQGYKFRGIDEVLNTLARIIADNKLVIVPHINSREVTERQTKSGGALFSVVVGAEYTFVSAEDGTSHTVGPFYGEAMDGADKATNKAMSAAYKYMAIQTFCIPTEGDNDADAQTHEVMPAPPKNANQARKADVWPRFVEKLRGFKDVDELESWWASASTQKAVDAMPGEWPKQAQEEYEKAQERLIQAGRP